MAYMSKPVSWVAQIFVRVIENVEIYRRRNKNERIKKVLYIICTGEKKKKKEIASKQ